MNGLALVNRAAWDGPDLPEGWSIVNAPRPLAGEKTWTGKFRHGIFYAAGPTSDERLARLWEADDAWPVVFTDNAEIERRVMAKLAEYGYSTPDEISSTVAEIAIGTLNLPWHEEG